MPTRRIATAAGATEPVTLAQAKQHLRTDCDDEDVMIGMSITTARTAAEDRLQRALVPSTWQLTLDEWPDVIQLQRPPVQSVEAVRYVDQAGQLQTLPPADYIIDLASEPARIVPAPGKSWPALQDRINAVEVDYVAGYPAGQVPAPLTAWMLLVLGDLMEQRSRSDSKPAVPQHFADSLLDTYIVYSL